MGSCTFCIVLSSNLLNAEDEAMLELNGYRYLWRIVKEPFLNPKGRTCGTMNGRQEHNLAHFLTSLKFSVNKPLMKMMNGYKLNCKMSRYIIWPHKQLYDAIHTLRHPLGQEEEEEEEDFRELRDKTAAAASSFPCILSRPPQPINSTKRSTLVINFESKIADLFTIAKNPHLEVVICSVWR